MVFVVEYDHAIEYAGDKFDMARAVVRGAGVVHVWEDDKWLGNVDIGGFWRHKTKHWNGQEVSDEPSGRDDEDSGGKRPRRMPRRVVAATEESGE